MKSKLVIGLVIVILLACVATAVNLERKLESQVELHRNLLGKHITILEEHRLFDIAVARLLLLELVENPDGSLNPRNLVALSPLLPEIDIAEALKPLDSEGPELPDAASREPLDDED